MNNNRFNNVSFCILSVVSVVYAVFIFRLKVYYEGNLLFTLIDDGMITMRYARHFAEGYGIVWNIGEPPVQGFTTMLWMLYLSFLHLILSLPSDICLAVIVSNAVFLLANMYVVRAIAMEISNDNRFVGNMAMLWTGLYFPLVFWSFRGMEVALISLLFSIITLKILGESHTNEWSRTLFISLLIFLMIFTRFDAVVQISILLAYSGIRAKQNGRINNFVFIVGSVVVALASTYLFSLYYFGDGFPNTYYLKVTGVSLSERLTQGLKMFLLVSIWDWAFPLLIVLIGILVFKTFNLKLMLILSLFLCQCAYSIYVGGDQAEFQIGGANRFILQGMPYLFILASCTIYRILEYFSVSKKLQDENVKSFALIFTVGVIFISLTCGKQWLNWTNTNAPVFANDIKRLKLGLFIKKITDPDAVIATHAAGQIPYYSECNTIDLLGKNDAFIAKSKPVGPFRPGHNKWNYEYSIGLKRPDVVADEWKNYTRDFIDNKASDYIRLKNGIWVKKDSKHVNMDIISRLNN